MLEFPQSPRQRGTPGKTGTFPFPVPGAPRKLYLEKRKGAILILVGGPSVSEEPRKAIFAWAWTNRPIGFNSAPIGRQAHSNG